MSLIIDLFIVSYLSAIVLASILGVVWVISLIFTVVKTYCPDCVHKHFTRRITRLIMHG